MLGGFTRMTMSLAVIVLEITTNMFMTLPVILVIVVSKLTGDLFTASTYDIVVALKNIPLLEPEIETKGWKKLEEVPVRCIGCPREHLDFIVASKSFTISEAVNKLVSSRHNAWPVVENQNNMRLLGILTRPKLLDCLEAAGVLPDEKGEIHLDSEANSGKELEIWAFASRDPFILLHKTSVLMAHTTFRTLGLRHLCIVDEQHAIVSLVTRTDLCEVVEEFVSDYKVALKDYADKIEAAEATSADDMIQKGASDFTLTSGGLPKGAVHTDTRAELRERRRQRVDSDHSTNQKDEAGPVLLGRQPIQNDSKRDAVDSV